MMMAGDAGEQLEKLTTSAAPRPESAPRRRCNFCIASWMPRRKSAAELDGRFFFGEAPMTAFAGNAERQAPNRHETH
jgi:hypothetical protein